MVSQLHEVQRPGQRVTGYEAPVTIEAALELLAVHGTRARPIAGGTDLLLELARGGRPGVEVLVDLGRIPGLDEITVDDATIRLGPLVTHNQVVAEPACRAGATPLAQACWEVAAPALRNRATVAGNLVTASPANDTLSALLALGATVELTGPGGTRRVALADFFTGFRSTALASGELLTAIEIPRLDPATDRGVFVKLGLRRAQAISLVHLSAVVSVGGDGTVARARLAVGSVAPTVIEVPGAAEALVGRPLDAAAIAAAAEAVDAAISPIDDLRATAAYRRQVTRTMTTRALQALAEGTHLARWPDDPPMLWSPGFTGRFPTGPDLALSAGADTTIATTVDGYPVTGPCEPGSTLLDWLRRHAGTNGVKEGCAEGECGACTVHLDGAAVLACLVPSGRAHGARITTVEGLAPDVGSLHPVQEAFLACGAVQCGFCTPGLLMASAKLLETHPRPTPAQVDAGLAGNLCRCTGYGAIHRALQLAPDLAAAHADGAPHLAGAPDPAGAPHLAGARAAGDGDGAAEGSNR